MCHVSRRGEIGGDVDLVVRPDDRVEDIAIEMKDLRRCGAGKREEEACAQERTPEFPRKVHPRTMEVAGRETIGKLQSLCRCRAEPGG
jgi:hypothetical protein